MSLKKRLSFKRTWNFNTVSKLRLASEPPLPPFVQSAVFLLAAGLCHPFRTAVSSGRDSCLFFFGVFLRETMNSRDLFKSVFKVFSVVNL